MNPQDDDRDEHLPAADAALLAQALAPQRPSDESAARMKAKILRGIAAAGTTAEPVPASSAVPAQLTVHTRDREWTQISRGVEMCTLHEDEHSRSFLLRMQADSFLLPHRHAMSEESILLEGDAIIGDDLHLAAGDYHFSPAGALHPLLQSPNGCIVFVRGEKGFRPRVTTGLIARWVRGLTGRRPSE